MDRSASNAIERAKVREVAAIFHSHAALEAAVQDLLLAGFDRADIDRLGDLDELIKRVGPVYVAHEELADIAQAPRQPVITREDISSTLVVVVGIVASFAGVITALVVVAFDGRTTTAVVGALLAALAAGGIAALLTRRKLKPPQSTALEPLVAAHGIVLWVRARTQDREDTAQQILHQHGGQAIRTHEIEIEKLAEEIPLSSLRPDPWLGDERLGQP
jgi:hypothetical protein